MEAGTRSPVAPDTPPGAACGHHTAPGSMTSCLMFAKNMEILRVWMQSMTEGNLGVL